MVKNEDLRNVCYMTTHNGMIFVTAKLKGQIDTRQGWIISESPFLIQGQSGIIYKCEGTPNKVINPPNKSLYWSKIAGLFTR